MSTRLTRRYVLALAAAAALALAGCAPGAGGPTTPGTGTPSQAGPTEPGGTGTVGTATVPPPPATEPTATVSEYRVTYNWGVPSSAVSIKHTVTIPIGGPNDPPLPYLVGVYVGDHPEGDPKYQRISFYFRGAFPSYNVGYVPKVISEGQGSTIPLQGNAFLRLGFVDAQAHDAKGASSVKATPKNPIGYANLKSYGFAGDFEGHVTYGLGLQVAPGSDQVLKIRAGELKKADGSGGFYYVVFFDVQNG